MYTDIRIDLEIDRERHLYACMYSHSVCLYLYTPSKATWPLHDIAITNIVWCMPYKGGVGGRAYIAQWSCNSNAIV